MKNTNLNLMSLASIVLFFSSNTAHAQSCDTYAEQDVRSAILQDGLLECGVTPNFTRVQVFEIAMCEQKPTASESSSCSLLYQSEAGQNVELTSSSSFPLTDQISIPEGNYPFAYVVISNEFDTQIQQEFSFDVFGVDSNGDKEGVGGAYCWTNGAQINAYEFGDMSCGTSPSAAVSTEIVSVLGLDDLSGDDIPDNNNGFHDPLFIGEGIPSSTQVPFDAYVTDSTGALAVATSDLSVVTDPPNPLPPSTNADRIMIVLTLSSSTLINEETTLIDVGFGVTDIGYINLVECSTGEICAYQGALGGFDLSISAQ